MNGMKKRFGLDHHKWLHYVGAYKNLTRGKVEQFLIYLQMFWWRNKTKLALNELMSAIILSLIGTKATTSEWKQNC